MGEVTLADARRRFFADSGFAPDGGYDDAWAHAQFGALPYSVPNPRIRAEALRVHDLHHPITGYSADWRGEASISAWELGSGGAGRYAYAWFIALFGFLTGLLASPGSTWRAFVAGRSARNLYRDPDPTQWLERPLEEVRRELIAPRSRAAGLNDHMAFAGWSVLAGSLALLFALGSPFLFAAALVRRATQCSGCVLSCRTHAMNTPPS